MEGKSCVDCSHCKLNVKIFGDNLWVLGGGESMKHNQSPLVTCIKQHWKRHSRIVALPWYKISGNKEYPRRQYLGEKTRDARIKMLTKAQECKDYQSMED